MINTWFTEMLFTANERLFTDEELARIQAYLQTVPGRLKLLEELEKNEETIVKQLQKELQRRYPKRAVYSRRLIQDIVEGLRHAGRAVLADDMRLVHHRWTRHLHLLVTHGCIDCLTVIDVYNVLLEILAEVLSTDAYNMIQPVIKDMIDGLRRTRKDDQS